MTRLFAGTPFDRPPECERCGQLEEKCECPPPEPSPPTFAAPGTQTAHLSVEKRKRGKVVTVIRGLAADENDLPALLTKLKTFCGAGGTLQEASIELQGRHVDRLRNELKAIGYKVKG
ncbi:MAG: translation initiation factor [Fuerstiella sp.]|jgi:translation initiation factor 1|nr:translation initiation factor [Fuerstiella sp.]MCP4512233.1 translation initiation factor [Fuerstiella sp.]MDG2130964.1 translation initiation factor [Fuerstiella sp.]